MVLFVSCAPEAEAETDPGKNVPESPEYPDKHIYTNAVFSMDDVPHDEPFPDISARRLRLSSRRAQFFNGLDYAISGGTLNAWLATYYKEFTSEKLAAEPYTTLVLVLGDSPKYSETLNPVLVDILRKNIPQNIDVFKEEVAKDIAGNYVNAGYPRDLNTVHPVRYALESAYALKLLDSYDEESRALIEALIEDYVEDQAYYFKGGYLTAGYNKEIFAIDIAFWVKMIYGDEKYPKTAQTFEAIWNNVTITSYDGDNSPHYDSTTGFYLVLRWGLMLGREDQMRESIHLQRLMDRMAKTVLNSGQSAKFGKSMENLYSSNRELALDGGRLLSWDLKVGYLLYGKPDYLYIARKYEDLRFNSLNVSRWKGTIYDLWPEGINFEDVADVPESDFGLVHVTDRITSRVHYNGLGLGRGDENWKVVQDKVVLSTGRHPNAPSMLIDLSYTQSKAAMDHRIGITSYQFMSAHIATILGRPGEPFRINRPMVAPMDITDFPVLKVPQGDVWPSDDYKKLMGYDANFDYVIEDYKAAEVTDYASCCDISYSKFQYEGVSARRQVVLLHNGIAVVYDRLTNNGNGALQAAATWNLWPSVASQGERWALQTGHVPTTVNMPAYSEIPVLFLCPETETASSVRIVTDEMTSNYEKGKTRTMVLQASEGLQPGSSVEFMTLVVPIKNPKASIDAFAKNVVCESREEGYVVYIPSPADKATKILFLNEGDLLVDDVKPAVWCRSNAE